MLNLYQSNQLGVLAELFCNQQLTEPDIFCPRTVIVQSMGMGQWLQLRLAERHDIAANIKSLLPAKFLWQLYRDHLPEAASCKESPFDRAHLAWRIMRILQAKPDLDPAIKSYLDHPGDKNLRLFQLANEIAGLFDQYLMYRPDWMLDWQKPPVTAGDHPHKQWQQRLWQLLLEDMKTGENAPECLHRAALHSQLMTLLEGDDVQTQLPDRLAVFGLSSMPPLQLETLTAIARHREVDIFFLNPCQHYWGDIVSPRELARRSVRDLLQRPVASASESPLEDEDYLEVGNPILSSLGKQGREFFELLLDNDQIKSSEHFVMPDSKTGLGLVQRDLLELEHGGTFGSGCVPEQHPLTDPSIQLQGCHSRQREVEVLHDRLLHLIRDNPDIKLHDIIVMVPDISDYAPLVQTLFGEPLSYRIADRNRSEESALLTAFMQLLALPNARITGAEILDLLASPAVSSRFNLNQKDLDLIGHWIIATGIRWETDGAAKERYRGLPPDNHNTWRFGLDRLLLGFAKAAGVDPWQGVLPFDITPSDTELVATLCQVIDRINHYRREFETSRCLADWRKLLSELLTEFFLPGADELSDHTLIQRSLEQLVQTAEASRYEAEVSLDLVRHLLGKALSEQSPRAGFIKGGITFATLVPMRSIPFRVVCLLGMNDGDYPRSGPDAPSFDCMASQRRKGDRSRKLDDRYLFLEALLSAQDVFYVSYLSRGIRDDQELPPSVIVTEWEDYLQSIFTDFKVQHHPLQPYSPLHYQGGNLQSFSRTWAEARQAAIDAQATDAQASDVPGTAQRFAPEALAPNDSLDCTSQAQLEQFFRHSGKYFLQQRLGVWLDPNEANFKESEPFVLDGLERYQLADEALAMLLRQEGLEQWERRALASGSIKSGEMGERQLTREKQRAQRIYKAASDYLTQPAATLTGQIELKGRPIQYQIDDCRGDILLDCRVGRLHDRQLLAAWIRHLFACATGHKVTSHCIAWDGKQPQTESLTPLTPGDSIAQLETLLAMYDQGITRPLLLPPTTSRAWYEHRDQEAVAREKAMTAWTNTWAGEQDRYWDRLFDMPEAMGPEFKEMATNIWQPLLAARGSD